MIDAHGGDGAWRRGLAAHGLATVTRGGMAIALTRHAGGASTTTGPAALGDDGGGGGSGSGGSGSGGSGSGGSGSGSSGSGSSSGGGCTVDPSASACTQCTEQKCCSVEQACASDPACGFLLKCLLGCGSDSTCVNACGNAGGNTAQQELVAALDCTIANCNSECNGATDAGCGSTPTLHPGTAGTIFCGYGADGGAFSCPTGDECCLGGALAAGKYAPETCAGRGSACTNGGDPDAGGSLAVPIACMQVADCKANGMANAVACCIQNATTPVDPAGCTYPRSSLGSAVTCESSPCAAGEVQICASQADCPAGKTCTPGKWKIYQVGFCL